MDSSKIKLGLLMLLTIVPISLATYFFKSGGADFLTGTSNKGSLIVPVLDITDLAMRNQQGEEVFQRFEEAVAGISPEDYEARPWLLVYLGDAQCDESCMDRLYYLRQLHAALGKESKRVERYYLQLSESAATMNAEKVTEFERLFPDMTRVYGKTGELADNLRRSHGETEDPIRDHYIYVVDPVGNVMLYFTPHNTPQDIMADLKKLLKQSSLG